MTEFAKLLDALGRDPDERLSVSTIGADGIFTPKIVTVGRCTANQIADTDWNRYYGTGVLHPRVTTGRGKEIDVVGVRELYADLDVKPKGLPTWDAAHEVTDTLAGMLGAGPVAIVNSGHGLQPHWALERSEATDWEDENDRRWLDAVALWRRWQRLIAGVADRFGGRIDGVFDLSRVLRIPGTTNTLKGDAVPVTIDWPGGTPITLERLAETLDEYGVFELKEDRERLGEIVAPPSDWTFGTRTCGYVATMVAGWATDRPEARHPWLMSQCVRLSTAHRLRCITEYDRTEAIEKLANRFLWLLKTTEPVRKPQPGEIQYALTWAAHKASTKTEAQARKELGDHRHPEPVEVPADALRQTQPLGSAEDLDQADELEQLLASWRPVDLTDAVAGRKERPRPSLLTREDGQCLFYAGQVNGVHGSDGVGKSFACLVASLQQLDAGRPVVWVDFEDPDETTIVCRLLDFGATPEQILEHFHYVHPDVEATPAAVAQVCNHIRTVGASLVVIDSVGEAFGMDGINEDRDNEVGPWIRRVARPLADTGAAVALIDHGVKNADNPLHPSGSKRKRAAITGASYLVEAVRTLSKEYGGGQLRLVTAKDRHGNHTRGRPAALIDITSLAGNVMAYQVLPPVAVEDTGGNDLVIVRAVIRVVKQLTDEMGKAPSMTLIEQSKAITVKASAAAKRAALEYATGVGCLEEAEGPRKARLFTYVKDLPT